PICRVLSVVRSPASAPPASRPPGTQSVGRRPSTLAQRPSSSQPSSPQPLLSAPQPPADQTPGPACYTAQGFGPGLRASASAYHQEPECLDAAAGSQTISTLRYPASLPCWIARAVARR